MLSSLLDRFCQGRMSLAADWLDAMWNKHQGFSIYSLLLGVEDASDGSLPKPHVLPPMALSCARSSAHPQQRAWARELLLRRLGTSADAIISPSEKMLSHMLLAQMFALDGQTPASEHHLKSALEPTVDSKIVDTSFDVLAYLHYKYPRPGQDSGPGDQSRKAHFLHQCLPSVNHDSFVRFVREMRGSVFKRETSDCEQPIAAVSAYVRSCIDWCAVAISNDSGELQDQFFDATKLALGTLPPNASMWPETATLYNYFHPRLRELESGRANHSPVQWKWVGKTRQTLGISSAELLVVCCDMMTKFGLLHRGYTNKAFTGFGRVQYSLDHARLREDLPKMTTPFALTNQPRKDSEEPLKPPLPAILESEIAPSGGDTAVFRFSTATGGSNPRWSEVGALTQDMAVYEPMTTTSCRSSNSSHQRMKDAAVSIFKRRYNSIDSQMSLSSRETRWSVAGSIDRLSDMMRDSLQVSVITEQHEGQQQVEIEPKEECISGSHIGTEEAVEAKDDNHMAGR
ncbi:hypothetical protein PG996_004421 [Apiospora saccharicola]|uniref:Uncharacterized protein n=1 Tax=Apiospora saccharicola TaxID=335842 RepID=A0ABR1W440_9PEZI